MAGSNQRTPWAANRALPRCAHGRTGWRREYGETNLVKGWPRHVGLNERETEIGLAARAPPKLPVHRSGWWRRTAGSTTPRADPGGKPGRPTAGLQIPKLNMDLGQANPMAYANPGDDAHESRNAAG